MPTPGDPAPVRRLLMTADAVGGVWPYALDLASSLGVRGVQVTLAVMGPPPRPAQRAEARQAGVDPVHRLFKLEWMPDPWGDVDQAGEWLLGLADEREADVVHLNGYCHAALPWRVPTLVVAHSCVRTWWRGVHGEPAPPDWDGYTDRVSAGLTAARLVVAPTRAMLEGLQHEYDVPVDGLVIPNGSSAVSLDSARRPCSASLVECREKMILASGRVWDAAKNIDALCAAAPLVPWPAYIAGDAEAPCRGTCAQVVGARHLGPLAPADMAAWYSRAAIFASPARYEPFGLSVLEAAAAGCALVLGDIRSLRENWDGAAIFVAPDNRRALVNALSLLIHDSTRRTELASAARTRARAHTVDAMADAYLQAYTNLLIPAVAA